MKPVNQSIEHDEFLKAIINFRYPWTGLNLEPWWHEFPRPDLYVDTFQPILNHIVVDINLDDTNLEP